MMLRLLVLIVMCHVITAPREERAAILIIDVQDCFLAGGSLAVHDGNDVIPVINKIRRKHGDMFSLVVLSKDWHCHDHVSFASQHPGKKAFEEVTLQYDKHGELCYGSSVPSSYPHGHNCSDVAFRVKQMLWPDHCIKNVSSGKTSSAIDSELIRKDSDVIIYKGNDCQVDSYSAFFDNGGFRQTQLSGVLKQRKINTVYVTGLALDYCVYYTSLDAKKLGYQTFIIADATRGVAADTTAAAVADLVKNGVNVIQSSALDAIFKVSRLP